MPMPVSKADDSFSSFEQAGPQHDLAGLGELERVAEEVEQYLPQASRVAAKEARDLRRDEGGHLESLGGGACRE
jgi:hypothetical protein